MVEKERHVARAAAAAAAAEAAGPRAERLAGGAMPPYPGQCSAAPAAGVALVLTAAAADGKVDAVERDAQHRPARAHPHRRGGDAAQRRGREERGVDDGAAEAAEQPAAVRWRPRVSWRERAEAQACDVHGGAAVGGTGGRIDGRDGGGVE